jgi:hypothetical protein
MTNSKHPGEGDEQQEREKWYERTRYQVLLFVGGVALFGIVLGVVLDWYINPQTSTQKKDLVQALGLITAGVAAAIGIFFTWRGQRITRIGQDMTQQNTQEQLQLTREGLQSTQKNTEQQLQLTQQGQLTERFTRAIDQLGKIDDKGSKLVEVRMGGIYALERIARESEEDYWAITEVLTAYLRQHARWQTAEGQQGEEEAGGSRGKPEPPEVPTPDPDILAIATILRRRPHYYGHGEPEPLDLRQTNLSQANLRGANLQGANLQGANLSWADLEGATLSGANLTDAHLWGAHLLDADLSGANLSFADLTQAFLTKAKFVEARLYSANLWSATLYEANLRGADLQEANLTNAHLQRADISGANLFEAVLAAYLEGADLSEAGGLTQAQIEQAFGDFGDGGTKLPPNLEPPGHWERALRQAQSP